jgi:ubiquinone/menaquinone biosynthesis C-methylase UbiE
VIHAIGVARKMSSENRDQKVVDGFGDEWDRFPQDGLTREERNEIFSEYFGIFPWDRLPLHGAVGADIGCGSGRWAISIAPRVGTLHLVDASEKALKVARRGLQTMGNVLFHLSSVSDMPFPDASLDFAYSLGVLHHVPDTQAALKSVAKKLRSGAPFLMYLYYAFDNRPWWYRNLWSISEIFRRLISRLPYDARYVASQVFAYAVYWPIARMAKLLEIGRILPKSWPLSYYRDRSLYTMRTDALDRFGTRLEHRFTKSQIAAMLDAAGFKEVRFSELPPYWCAVAIRR